MNIELIRQDEYSTIYAVPITLRQVEAAGLPLEGGFGIDEQEHAGLLDDPEILRIAFGVVYSPEENSVDEQYLLEAYQLRLGGELGWEGALDLRHATGWYGSPWSWRKIQSVLRDLVSELVPHAEVLLEPHRAEYQAWADQVEFEALRESGELITQAVAAQMAGVTVQAINNAIRDGRLTPYRDPDPERQRQAATLVREEQVREVYEVEAHDAELEF